MQNDTWVCFECRTALRRPTGRVLIDGELPKLGQADRRISCPSCDASCQFLGPTIKVPRKGAVKVWQKLRERVEEKSVDQASERAVERVRWSHTIERADREELQELEARPPNAHRAKLIAELKRRLARA
ncbi:MAG: hypothetical protein JWM57_1294 [Phycisphaerales bacterium]|nr:hypothetical protein [Phycisphaerales bacterium]